MVDRAALEMRWAARSRGFESLPLRHLAKPNGVNAERSKLTQCGNKRRHRGKAAGFGAQPRGTRVNPSLSAILRLWASDGTANFEKHKIRAGRYSATAKDALRSLGVGGSFPWASDGTANFSQRIMREPIQTFSSSFALRTRRFNSKCWGKK